MPLQDPSYPISVSDLAPGDFDTSGDHVALNLAGRLPQFTADPETGQFTIVLPEGEDAGKYVTNGGFDVDADNPTTGVLTLNMSDGTQVPVGMPGIVTVAALEARSKPMVSAFGRPLGYTSVE